MNKESLQVLTKQELVALAKQHGHALADYARKSKEAIVDELAGAGIFPTSVPASVSVKVDGDAAQQLQQLLQKILGTPQIDEAKVRQIVDACTADAISKAIEAIPARKLDVTRDGKTVTIEGRQHFSYEELLTVTSTGLNVWLTGPAGSGKTTAAENVAKALGLPFYFTGAIDTEYKLLGFVNAIGVTVRTQFREAWEFGGVFLFDEVDGSGASALLALNAALANGVCPFPDVVLPKHKDFICLAAANTWGLGATMEYVGRAKLDASSLDRFVKMAWDYDEALELEISGNVEWAKYVQGVRAKARAKGLKHVISPRASIAGAKLLAAGLKKDRVCAMTLGAGLSKEQWDGIK